MNRASIHFNRHSYHSYICSSLFSFLLSFLLLLILTFLCISFTHFYPTCTYFFILIALMVSLDNQMMPLPPSGLRAMIRDTCSGFFSDERLKVLVSDLSLSSLAGFVFLHSEPARSNALRLASLPLAALLHRALTLGSCKYRSSLIDRDFTC